MTTGQATQLRTCEWQTKRPEATPDPTRPLRLLMAQGFGAPSVRVLLVASQEPWLSESKNWGFTLSSPI